MFSPEENIGFYYSYVSTVASIDPAGDFFDTFYPVSGQQPSAMEVMAAGEDSLHQFEGKFVFNRYPRNEFSKFVLFMTPELQVEAIANQKLKVSAFGKESDFYPVASHLFKK
ncbi:hypothetical protein [Paenibacillus dendritiformis]|uniref:hypothetical protein n=1 Tax=Paenibacillus dendritiformis TaxID=130049 RepID=UPI00387E1CD3